MIKDLTIENYRLFQHFNVNAIARVNLIVGTNNSGKSSLLEAIHLLTSDDVRSSLIYILSERGEFVSGILDPRLERGRTGGYQISQIFYERALKLNQAITIRSFEEVNSALRMTLQGVKLYDPRPYDPAEGQMPIFDDEMAAEDHIGSIVVERDGQDIETQAQRLLLTEDGLFVDRPLNARRITHPKGKSRLITTNNIGYDELAILWDKITLTPKEDKVVEALKILEPDVERISFTSSQTSNSGILLKLGKEKEPIPLGSMGDGMRRILAVIASLVSVDKGTLLVDEIDTGLYYEVITDMWRLVLETAARQGAQVFATTHSWDCVKAFQKALTNFHDPDSGRLMRLEKSDNQVQAVLYSADELDIAIKEGIEVR